MNFFEQQSLKRHQSLALLLCFLVALVAIGVLIHVTIAGFAYLLGDTQSFVKPSKPALVMIGLVWLTVFAGCCFRYMDVRAGAAVLARRYGAVRASDRSRFDQEKQLLNVVAEVAIASSTAQPDVYVLRHETSINAFVLGNETEQHVVVVTQGALDAFDRDELQAVIAHEFGHIANGDLPMNMRLLIALGGLLAIDEVGRTLLIDNPLNEDTGGGGLSNPGSLLAHPGVIVGYLLVAIGSIGVVAGRVIKAAFSRQREFLADATAVQFTRQPFALASALDKINMADRGEPALHSPYAAELAHLCIQSGNLQRWYKRLLSTHPRIQRRIDAIDPHFAIKNRKVKRARADADQTVEHFGGQYTGKASDARADGIARDAGSNELPDKIMLLLPDESSCLAMLFALFVSDDVYKRREYMNALSFSFNQQFTSNVKEVVGLIPDELRNSQLAIIEHATAVLRNSLKPENRQRIVKKLENLLRVSGDHDLMNYATLQLIRRRLDVEFPVVEMMVSDKSCMAHARQAKAFDSMGSEFALLLSLMVESSGGNAEQLDAEFARVLQCYTNTKFPRRTANETGIITELEAAFQTLYVQPKPIRRAFVQHCMEIVRHDGYVARAEQTLLNLFAASLGCEELAA